jgi:dolichyl-diphosphooligosaccharide--protein glycosyltransferase
MVNPRVVLPRLLPALAVLALALSARLAPWPTVFSNDGVLLKGTDSYYHALRAERTVRDYPRPPWFDPWLNYPQGAPILWPPLFDQFIATGAWLMGGREASRQAVATTAALVPPALGVLTIALLAALGGRLLDRAAGWVAAGVLALLPAHVYYSEVGQADQHVAEVCLAVAVLLAFVACFQRQPGAKGLPLSTLALAVGLAAAFWNWMGSGLLLALLCAHAAACHAWPEAASDVRPARALAAGAGLAAVLLAASLAAGGPAGALARVELSNLNGFHVLLCVAAAAFGALLAAAAAARPSASPSERLSQAVLVGVAVGGAALLWPGVRAAASHALAFLTRGNPWYRTIVEFEPPLFSGTLPWPDELRILIAFHGLVFLATPLLLAVLWGDVRRNSREALLLLVCGSAFFALALARRRFDSYVSVTEALLVAVLWRRLATRARGVARPGLLRWVPEAVLVLLLAPAVWSLRLPSNPVPFWRGDLLRTLTWLGRYAPGERGGAVLAGWDLGHFVQWAAGKPVLVSPFGTDAGATAMQDAARLLATDDDAAFHRLLAARQVGFLVLRSPLQDAAGLLGFLPTGADPPLLLTRSYTQGRTAGLGRTFWSLPASRLYYFDGSAVPPVAAVDGLRLVYEGSGETTSLGFRVRRFKVFERVAGAALEVEDEPGRTVEAWLDLRTNQARTFRWTGRSVVDADRLARLRLPYASAANGAVTAVGPYRIGDGWVQRELAVTAEAVLSGAPIRERLAARER